MHKQVGAAPGRHRSVFFSLLEHRSVFNAKLAALQDLLTLLVLEQCREARKDGTMDRGPKVTLGPEVEAVGAEVGMEMFGTAPLVEADGREILLRADGETFMESRALGAPMLELLPRQRLGSLR